MKQKRGKNQMENEEVKNSPTSTSSVERKRQNLGHDDDGNIDDKRVSAWILFALIIFLGYQAVTNDSATALSLVELTIWPWMVLMGATVAEKFKPGGKI